MEDALAQKIRNYNRSYPNVLILVVMEDALARGSDYYVDLLNLS